ncbi:MAG: S1/P1 nuclease [Bacteroidales bacterium]|nr:S1/P1 nuclease [Bacteroidales bacterium]
MKNHVYRISAVLFLVALIPLSARGWGRMGHATVAKIAQNHLTKTTQKRIAEIMHGTPLVAIASYCDDYRSELDASFPLEWTQGIGHAHTFEVDPGYRPFATLYHPETGRKLTNAIYFADHCLQDLSHAADFPDSVRWKELVMVTHLLGDMHCPGHVRYADRHDDIGKYPVTFAGEQTTYHRVWDALMVTTPLPFSFSDIAEICDDCSPAEIEAICKGTIYDWGQDVADKSRDCRLDIEDGDVINAKWIRDHAGLMKIQIRNAGYRLAHVLNMTFDPKYARKHNK